jgi:hypothetical protein
MNHGCLGRTQLTETRTLADPCLWMGSGFCILDDPGSDPISDRIYETDRKKVMFQWIFDYVNSWVIAIKQTLWPSPTQHPRSRSVEIETFHRPLNPQRMTQSLTWEPREPIDGDPVLIKMYK